MNLPNKPKVLVATYNPVSNTKMISFLVDFPTVLLAELRTHRIITQGSLYEHMELDNFNMSANSARAIPANKYLQKVLDNPFIPIWTKQQKGMSGELITDKEKIKFYDNTWKGNLQTLIDYGIENYTSGENVHKQNVNRLLAPFAYTTCIISGTEWDGFFSLRCPEYEIQCATNGKCVYKSKKALLEDFPDYNGNWNDINKSTAQPEFQVIAEMLYDLYQEVDWKESKYHIPFYDNIIKTYYKDLDKIGSTNDEYVNNVMLISASMCAKLSYNTQDNEDTLEKHLERANILMTHKHQEPFSHQAIAMSEEEYFRFIKGEILKTDITHNNDGSIVLNITEDDGIFGWCYNLNGFISQRYILENY